MNCNYPECNKVSTHIIDLGTATRGYCNDHFEIISGKLERDQIWYTYLKRTPPRPPVKYYAISLLQPWASLSIDGHKRIETRTRNTKFRGMLLIHASQGWGSGQRSLCLTDPFREALEGYSFRIPKNIDLPLGAIIGCVQIRAAIPSENSYGAECVIIDSRQWDFSRKEKAFGDYNPNRHLYLMSDPIKFETPIPCKGKVMIPWEVDSETSKLVTAQLELAKRNKQ